MKNSILKIITVFAVSLIITPSTLPSDTLQISVGYSKPMPFPPAYIRGYVRDNASHSPLPGANVQAVGSPQSGGTNVVFTTTTNENGYYELLVHSGYYYTVTASYEGYNSQTQNTGYLMSGAQKWIYFYLDSSSPGYTLWNSPSYTVWFAPATTKIFNSTQPPVSTSSTIEIECARNENEPFQIVIQPAFLLTNVTVEIGDLINQETGENIGKENISVNIVEYVPVKGNLYPDPLSPYTPFNVSEEKTQPVWITISVKPEVKAGNYQGIITIIPQNAENVSIPLTLTVWNFTLPNEMHCRTAFGLNKWKVKQFHNINWDQYYDVVRKEYYRNYRDHCVAPGFIEPWYYDALTFSWTETGNSFNFVINYTESDKLASLYLDDYGFSSFMFGKGIPKTFCGYENWTQKYNKAIITFWREVSNHLAARGWLEKGYYFILDEPYIQASLHGGNGIDYVNKIKNFAILLKTANPDIKIAQTLYCKWDEPYQILKNYIDIWIPNLQLVNDNVINTIKSNGAEPWFYVCFGNQGLQPNYFIKQSAMASRIFGWMQWKYEVKGNLYYSTTSWTQNPWNNPVHSYWNKAGEGFLLYPPFKEEVSPKPCFDGPVSSIRWELTREGIEDYEYLWLLNHYIETSFAPWNVKQHAIQTLNSAVTTMVVSKTEWNKSPSEVYRVRKAIATEIENLTQYLTYDIVFPDTTLTTSPNGVTSQHTVQFSWTGEDDTTPPGNLRYSYILYGYNIYWSPWTTSTTKVYNNLPSGVYTFKVKAKDLDGNIDPIPAEATFVINDPPTANFTYTPINPDATDNITFYDISTDDFEIVNWLWNFGDGETGKGEVDLNFSGNNEYVDCGRGTSLDITDNLTVRIKSKYNGGVTLTIQGENTDKQIGYNYNDEGTMVRRADTENGTGYMLIVTRNDLQGAYHWYSNDKIPTKPSDSVKVYRKEVWDVTLNKLVASQDIESDSFENAGVYQSYKNDPLYFYTEKDHTYTLKIYYYGNIDVFIDYIRLTAYHRTGVAKSGSWRIYPTYMINWLVWHPDKTYTTVTYSYDCTNKWVDIVGTYSSTDGLKLYLNGTLVAQKPPNGKLIRSVTNPLRIGRQSTLHTSFNGLVDEVMVYNRTLNALEIEQLHNGNVVENGLVSWWKLNEGCGDITHDYISGNDGVLHGATWLRYAKHSYPNPGTYTVTLTVKDFYGSSDSLSRTITVGGGSLFPETEITAGPTGVIHYNNVTFEWTGVDDTTPPNNLFFSYKLEGYDSGWSTWSHTTSVSYYNLPNGGYTFKVKAKDEEGNIDPSPATREFMVHLNKPPFITEFSPYDGEENITINPGNNIYPELNVAVTDPDGDTLTIIFSTNASGTWQTIEAFTGGNGTYTTSSSLMNNWLTWYYWSVNVTDGYGWVNQSLCFKTKPADWDINMDNMVDINDVTGVTAYYGEVGEPGWVRADVNVDGEIDIKDVTAVTAHYGEQYG